MCYKMFQKAESVQNLSTKYSEFKKNVQVFYKVYKMVQEMERDQDSSRQNEFFFFF